MSDWLAEFNASELTPEAREHLRATAATARLARDLQRVPVRGPRRRPTARPERLADECQDYACGCEPLREYAATVTRPLPPRSMWLRSITGRRLEWLLWGLVLAFALNVALNVAAYVGEGRRAAIRAALR
jgi:hypothetical protein